MNIYDLPIPQDRLIFLSLRGSFARNLATESSDKDYVGAFFSKPEYYFGFDTVDNYTNNDKIDDWIIYELRRYVKLLCAANPNILETLWTADEHFLHISPAFRLLRLYRSYFATKQIYHTFYNYSVAQLHRMNSVTKELVEEFEELENLLAVEGINIQELSPKQSERDRILDSGPYKNKVLNVPLNRFIEIKKKYFNGGGRLGQRRKEVIKKYGFDTKNASILIMLLKQTIEFLQTGDLQVDRTHDKIELLSIKKGQWTLTEVKAYVNKLSADAKQAFENSRLPDDVNYGKVERLLIEIFRQNKGIILR